jgi:hypothetical protein
VNSAGSDDGSLPSTASGLSTPQSSGYPMPSRPGRKTSQPTDSSRLGTHTEEASAEEGGRSTRNPDTDAGRPTHHRLRSDGQVQTATNTEPARYGHRPKPPSLDIATPKMGTPKPDRSKDLQPPSAHGVESFFARRPILPRSGKSSASTLTKMLAAQSAVSDNPFTELYGAIAGRGDVPSMTLNIFFPESKKPFSAVKITIRKDATVEEVIGFGLWTYWEQKLEPPLDEGLSEDDPQRSIVLSASGWILRIGEEDGEVDEDFPGIS